MEDEKSKQTDVPMNEILNSFSWSVGVDPTDDLMKECKGNAVEISAENKQPFSQKQKQEFSEKGYICIEGNELHRVRGGLSMFDQVNPPSPCGYNRRWFFPYGCIVGWYQSSDICLNFRDRFVVCIRC